MSVSGISSANGNWLQLWADLKARSTGSATSTTAAGPATASGGTPSTDGALAAAMAQSGVQSMTGPSGSGAMTAQSAGVFQQAMSTIGTSLQGGNVSGAQDAFAQASAALSRSGVHHHHHHHGGGGAASSSATDPNGTSTDPFAQAFSALGSALQGGDTTAAQSAFQHLQALLQSSPNPLTGMAAGGALTDPTGGAVDVLA